MSLFKVRDLWQSSSRVDEEDIYDFGCLCVANVDNSLQGYDKIIVSNYTGRLCVYCPSFDTKGDNHDGFKVEDLALDMELEAPILQVSVGIFVSDINVFIYDSGKETLHLGILHPRKLAVYSITEGSGAAVVHGSQYRISLCYEHNLQRSAFHFCYGPFGRVKGKDNICVQSMDGTLAIYEQETFSFSRFLPGTLLPGPLQYVAKTDSFVTVSSSRQLESYRYETLAIATDSNPHDEPQKQHKSGRRAVPEWTYNLGEEAMDLRVVDSYILVLGERSILCLSDVGQLSFCKKLEYNASCICPYISGSQKEGSVQYIMASHSSTLLVYTDTCLNWAAAIDSLPVHVCVANFSGLSGAIVSVDDAGRVRCSCLGTHPTLFTAPLIQSRDLSYDEMDAEMVALEKTAKSLARKTALIPKVEGDDDLTVTCRVSTNLSYPFTEVETDLQQSNPDLVLPSVSVNINLKSRVLLENLSMHVIVQWPLTVEDPEISVPSIAPSKSHDCEVRVYQRHVGTVVDLTGLVKVRYHNSAGVPRVVTTSFRLPLKLVVHAALPEKAAEYKVTIDTNKEPVNLLDLYGDLSGENQDGPGAALGFSYLGGPIVTVLVSKTSQRYRIQSSRFESLWLVTYDLYTRLKLYFAQQGQSDFLASYSGSLPFKEIFDVIDVHFEHRVDLGQSREVLSQKAAQFRVIQRRLLAKFKDKTLSSLSHLDTLLESNYQQIIALSDTIQEIQSLEVLSANDVSACINLLIFILQIWLHLPELDVELLKGVLSPTVSNSDDQGWEEMVDASVTHVLRTTMARSTRDHTLNPAPLSRCEDLTKFKKHIALLCDKLEKGSRLSDVPSTNNDQSSATRTTKATSQPGFHAAVSTSSDNLSSPRNDLIEEDISPVDRFITPRKTRPTKRPTVKAVDAAGVPAPAPTENGDTNRVSLDSVSSSSLEALDAGVKRSYSGLVPDLDDLVPG